MDLYDTSDFDCSEYGGSVILGGAAQALSTSQQAPWVMENVGTQAACLDGERYLRPRAGHSNGWTAWAAFHFEAAFEAARDTAQEPRWT